MSNSRGRHELKHNINYADMLQLRSRLALIATPDEHCLDSNGYRVKSLYFDNLYDKALREKIDGVNKREKFRLRLYNNDISFIRLEKKSKVNGICFKESARISYDECCRLLNGDAEVLMKNGNPLCQELYTKMQYQQLRPKNIVDYQREAYCYRMGNVRITLDYDLRTSFDPLAFLRPEPIALPVTGCYILEVKYDNSEVIRGIVSLSSRHSSAFSKYAVTRII